MAEYAKPIPVIDEASRPFFEGARQRKLMLMYCPESGAYRFPSRAHDPISWSTETEWREASGRGTVYTFGVMHQLYHPGFEPDLPYVIAVVELEEGPRIPTNLVDVKPEDVKVGMPVQVTFEDISDEITLPKFRPA